MRTARANLVVLIAVMLALGAGVTAGLLIARLPLAGGQPPAPAPGPGDLDELRLSATQKEQMRAIWEGVQKTVQDCFDDARSLQRQREDALLSLLNDDQKSRFEKRAADYARQFDGIVQRREKVFKDAIQRTRQILDPTQRQAYDRMIQRRIGPAATQPRSPEDLLAPPQLGASAGGRLGD